MDTHAPWSLENELTEEHRHLDRILGDVEFLTERRSFRQAAKRFAELRHLLDEHLELEERVVLPLCVQATGNTSLTKQVEGDHLELRGLVNEVAQAISWSDVPAFVARVSALSQRLEAHHDVEEASWHPVVSQLIRSREDWIRHCSRVPAEARIERRVRPRL